MWLWVATSSDSIKRGPPKQLIRQLPLVLACNCWLFWIFVLWVVLLSTSIGNNKTLFSPVLQVRHLRNTGDWSTSLMPVGESWSLALMNSTSCCHVDVLRKWWLWVLEKPKYKDYAITIHSLLQCTWRKLVLKRSTFSIHSPKRAKCQHRHLARSQPPNSTNKNTWSQPWRTILLNYRIILLTQSLS